MEKITRTLEDLSAEAARFLHGLAPLATGATLITLSGELGAGKTAFVKAVAQAFGVGETVTSPTFVLEKIYALTPKSGHPMSTFGRLIHIDAYRLSGAAELAPLGFDELMRDRNNIILLEWPERVVEALPPVAFTITLAARPDGSHTISYG
ncbi:MAG: tRNA (adenosine(37)-N6)-threonylcarbamoyltransferase complex ATPase subunit type 1 TsaE [bacterium]|nr:tRNA (adenosine(37)-N6)-threonylcarbamoyltransferase complex ATPase subunit type 1 TsaE [bacterium]